MNAQERRLHELISAKATQIAASSKRKYMRAEVVDILVAIAEAADPTSPRSEEGPTS